MREGMSIRAAGTIRPEPDGSVTPRGAAVWLERRQFRQETSARSSGLEAQRRRAQLTIALCKALMKKRQAEHDYSLVANTPPDPIARIGMPTTGWADRVSTRIDAAARLRRLSSRIGAEAFTLIVWLVAEDRSWREIGRQLGCGEYKAKRAAVDALERLIEHS